jgi:hypothetical protein
MGRNIQHEIFKKVFNKVILWWKQYCFHVWQVDHDSTYDYKRTCIKCGKIDEGSYK